MEAELPTSVSVPSNSAPIDCFQTSQLEPRPAHSNLRTPRSAPSTPATCSMVSSGGIFNGTVVGPSAHASANSDIDREDRGITEVASEPDHPVAAVDAFQTPAVKKKRPPVVSIAAALASDPGPCIRSDSKQLPPHRLPVLITTLEDAPWDSKGRQHPSAPAPAPASAPAALQSALLERRQKRSESNVRRSWSKAKAGKA